MTFLSLLPPSPSSPPPPRSRSHLFFSERFCLVFAFHFGFLETMWNIVPHPSVRENNNFGTLGDMMHGQEDTGQVACIVSQFTSSGEERSSLRMRICDWSTEHSHDFRIFGMPHAQKIHSRNGVCSCDLFFHSFFPTPSNVLIKSLFWKRSFSVPALHMRLIDCFSMMDLWIDAPMSSPGNCVILFFYLLKWIIVARVHAGIFMLREKKENQFCTQQKKNPFKFVS